MWQYFRWTNCLLESVLRNNRVKGFRRLITRLMSISHRRLPPQLSPQPPPGETRAAVTSGGHPGGLPVFRPSAHHHHRSAWEAAQLPCSPKSRLVAIASANNVRLELQLRPRSEQLGTAPVVSFPRTKERRQLVQAVWAAVSLYGGCQRGLQLVKTPGENDRGRHLSQLWGFQPTRASRSPTVSGI